MQALSGSVGAGGANAPSDVALVQVVLMKTVKPKPPGATYLAAYDGVCSPATIDAIRAFQDEAPITPVAGQPPLKASGLIAPGSPDWIRLAARAPVGFRDLRCLPGGRTVYLAASAQDQQDRLDGISSAGLNAAFADKIVRCLKSMFTTNDIAIGLCPQGGKRTFQEQYVLLTSGRGVTKAGPGESNHNFGMAVDLGFAGLRWVKKDGTVAVKETPWLHQLTAAAPREAQRFWTELRTIGTSAAVGAFPSLMKGGDPPHLQNWNDHGVSMRASLADLLIRAGSMRWKIVGGSYACDLGFGGDYYVVGAAGRIWNGEALVTTHMLDVARLKKIANAKPLHAVAIGHARPAAGVAVAAAPPPASATDVRAMQLELRHQFALAEAASAKWQAR